MKRGRKTVSKEQRTERIQPIEQERKEPKRSKDGSYLFCGDVMDILQISRNAAYVLIRKLNKELEEAGYITIAGRVPSKYFYERMYC